MPKVKKCSRNGNIYTYKGDYIGCWYPSNCMPQQICLYVHEDYCYIGYRLIDNSISRPEFDGMEIAINLPLEILHPKEERMIKSMLKEQIEALQKSYTEYYDGNTYKGSWDQKLVLDLRRAAEELNFESCLNFAK